MFRDLGSTSLLFVIQLVEGFCIKFQNDHKCEVLNSGCFPPLCIILNQHGLFSQQGSTSNVHPKEVAQNESVLCA